MTEMNDRLKAIKEKLEELKVERREGALERREKVKARSGVELGVREMEESGSKSSFSGPFPGFGPIDSDPLLSRVSQRKVKID